jgi:hypothetical protein
MKIVRTPSKVTGEIPQRGELFAVPKGANAVYMRVETPHGTSLSMDDPKHEPPEDSILGVSLESGIIHWLPIKTTRRDGFIILDPEDGALRVTRRV